MIFDKIKPVTFPFQAETIRLRTNNMRSWIRLFLIVYQFWREIMAWKVTMSKYSMINLKNNSIIFTELQKSQQWTYHSSFYHSKHNREHNLSFFVFQNPMPNVDNRHGQWRTLWRWLEQRRMVIFFFVYYNINNKIRSVIGNVKE